MTTENKQPVNVYGDPLPVRFSQQSLFDLVWKNLAVRKKPRAMAAKQKGGKAVCCYITPQKTSCALGMGMTEAEAVHAESTELYSVESILQDSERGRTQTAQLRRLLPKRMHRMDRYFLKDVQECHDLVSTAAKRRRELLRIAKEWKLKVPA